MNSFNRYFLGNAVVIVFLCAVSLAVADEQGQAVADEAKQAGPYSGDIWHRSTLTGDWSGVRNDLARKGVTFDLSVTQTYQGVADGGKDPELEYGGRGDLTLKMDSGKMGLWPGGFLTVELEGNWGKAVNRSTGALMTVDTNQAFPVVGKDLLALPL